MCGEVQAVLTLLFNYTVVIDTVIDLSSNLAILWWGIRGTAQ